MNKLLMSGAAAAVLLTAGFWFARPDDAAETDSRADVAVQNDEVQTVSGKREHVAVPDALSETDPTAIPCGRALPMCPTNLSSRTFLCV